VNCQKTPFDNLDSALEYVGHLLEASREAQQQVHEEIRRTQQRQQTRRCEAFQVVSYKVDRLAAHVEKCERLLKDLRRLRRIILEEQAPLVKSATA